MSDVLVTSEDFDRCLPPLPNGWTMTLYEGGPDDWRCDLTSENWHKLAAEIIGVGWSPRAAVADAIAKIK